MLGRYVQPTFCFAGTYIVGAGAMALATVAGSKIRDFIA